MASRRHVTPMVSSHFFLYPAFLSLFILCTSAQLFSPVLTDCHTPTNVISPSYLINLTSAYAQFLPTEEATALGLVHDNDGVGVIRVDLIGVTGEVLQGFDNTTGKLATMFTVTTDLTYDVYTTTTYVCNSLFPPSPLPSPYFPYNTTYCPFPAGPLGINLTIPLSSNYPLSTLTTTIRIVDTAVPANELTCAVLSLTPYYPDAWYYDFLLWTGVILAIGFWISSWAGRFAAGWVVGRMLDGDPSIERNGGNATGTQGSGGQKETDRVIEGWGRSGGQRRKWGTMLISGLSGERLGVSGGLLRFITPGFRDVIWHLQFCAVLAMIAVQWPEFAYPILAQGAWASLVWNATIVQGAGSDYDKFSHLLDSMPSDIPANFGEQFNSTAYPLYMDELAPNRFLDLHEASPGIASFAAAIGLRPQDMYPTCIVLFLCFGATIILLSLAIWFLHGVSVSIQTQRPVSKEETPHPPPARTSWAGSPASSDFLDLDKRRSSSSIGKGGQPPLESPTAFVPPMARNKSSDGLMATRKSAPTSIYKRIWWQFKIKGAIGQFHWNALCGNLVRLIVLCHLPVTLFSVYQWSIREEASLITVVFSAVSFAVISILLPVYLTIRIWRMPTGKLYDATRTLLSLGPMYNMYKQGSQYYQALRFLASLATGIVVGAGQASGLAQAIILVGIEIAFGLVTIFWQPWRPGAGMAISTVIFSSLRIASGVLLLLMSSTIGFSIGVKQWLAYVLLGLQALTMLTLLIMLICKILEGIVRFFGNVRFEHSTHPLDGGFLSAFGGLAAARTKRRKRFAAAAPPSHRTSTAGSINTQMMLDRHSTYSNAWGASGDPSQYPPQRTLSTGPGWTGEPQYAPVEMEEMLNEQPPVSGFHVNRGQSGKAEYGDPYAAVPQDSPSHSRDPSRENTAGWAPPGHQRSRSQTAVVETTPSPSSAHQELPNFGPSSSAWPPNTLGMSSNGKHGRPMPPALSVQMLGIAEQTERGESPVSLYSDYSHEATDKAARKGWFDGKSKKKTGDDSDSDEDGDIGTPKGGKGWLRGFKSSKAAPLDADAGAPSDENTARKGALPPDFAPASGGQASGTTKSFSVNRAARPGGSSSPATSNPPTGPPTPPSADSQPRSFRVIRQGQSRAHTPEPTEMQPSQERKQTFVVNRPSKPGPVAFQPLSGNRS